jgi:type II secretory pathway component PulF
MNAFEHPLPSAEIGSSPAAEMPPALRALSTELSSRRVAGALRRLSDRISRGEPWDIALNAGDVHLPVHVRALLQASLRAQRLPQSLAQLVDLDRRRNQLQREVRLALAYPLLLLAALGVLFLLYEFYFIREIMTLHGEIISDFRLLTSTAAELPTLTQVALYLSRPVPLGVVATMMAAVALLVAARQAFHPPSIDALFNRLPVLGSLWYWSAMADCARVLSLLLEAQIPLPQALGIAATAMRNGEIAAGCWDLVGQVQAGHALAAAMERNSAFPPTLAPLVRWGETHLALPEALQAAAEMLEGRVQIQLEFVRTFLPPMMFLVVASAIFFSLLAAFYPMFRLVEALA